MENTKPYRFRCDGVSYRAGFIETQLVHPNHINLEVWSIDPETMRADADWVTDISEAAVTGNVELELDFRVAIQLADSLQEFIAMQSPISESDSSCEECGSRFRSSHSTMPDLCPECSHYLYNKPNCAHSFCDGRCRRCGWDGSVSDYVATIKGTASKGQP